MSIGENPEDATVRKGGEGVCGKQGVYDSNNKLVLKAGARISEKNLKSCALMANHDGEKQEE
ncbi:hypothetical protein [Fodinicurvata sediminis]|uniref:hypothetical protein n=1 Tax=Fodinicurvata sediminis TaxID=1121832 RepID=UPI0012DFA698|nr:hypothetical protein [Fodinicurvata sediminis]